MPIFPSLYPMDSDWESWISQAFGKQMPGRAGRKSTPEQANSRKMSNQIFFLSHSLDKLPSERHSGRLDLLVTTDYLVSKKRTRRIPDPRREMSESTEHTIPKTWAWGNTSSLLLSGYWLASWSASLTELSIYPEQEGTRDSIKVQNKKTLATLGHPPTGLAVAGYFVLNQWLSPGHPLERVQNLPIFYRCPSTPHHVAR